MKSNTDALRKNVLFIDLRVKLTEDPHPRLPADKILKTQIKSLIANGMLVQVCASDILTSEETTGSHIGFT